MRHISYAQMTVMRKCRFTLAILMMFYCTPAPLHGQCRADDVPEWTLPQHASEVTGLAFTPDGTRLISTSLQNDRVTRLAETANPLDFPDQPEGRISGARSHAVAVNPDGTFAAIAGFRMTAVYDLNTLRQLWKLDTTEQDYSPPYVSAVVFSPDGRWLATSGSSSRVGGPHGYKGGLITIRDANSGEEIHRYNDLSHASGSIAFSPDGKLFAAGTYGAGGELPEPGELRIWDAKTGKLMHVWKVKDFVRAGEEHYATGGVAFSPDSHTIAVGSSDRTVRLWDVATRQVRMELKGHRSGVRRVVFNHDGRILASAGGDRAVLLWEMDSGQQINSFSVRSPKINALIFSPDGNLLVAGGGDFLRSGEVRAWRVQNVLQK